MTVKAPPSAVIGADLETQAKEIIGRYEHPRAAMLPLLWLAQRHFGYVTPESEEWISRLLGVAVVHVREVVSFYSMFHTKPVGRRVIRVCTSLPCLLKGGKSTLAQIKQELGSSNGSGPDYQVFIEEVECLCACEMAPMAQLDEQFTGPLDEKRLELLVREAKKSGPGPSEQLEPAPHVATDGPVISLRFKNTEGTWFDEYARQGGYAGAKKVLFSMKPAEVIEEVTKANLRGLGGAGFPAAKKWSFIPKDTPKPKYLVVNADEGEPGTFKDRYILERDPHAVLEGMIIAAYAISCHKAYIYIRGEYFRSAKRFSRAVEEAYKHGWLGKNIQNSGFDLDVVVHNGAGAYICGEETALLTSLEGGKGFPRIKPPFPAISGLFGCPTIVNNVETLACVSYILREGGAKFAALGTPKQGGTRLFSVSGHVNRPGLYEAPVSVRLTELIHQYAQGVPGGRKIKAVIPGGISAKILTVKELEVGMDFDSLGAAGTMAGSGGVIVLDEATCMLAALESASRFFAHESCGQCSPCREGTGWIHRIITRITTGKGHLQDLDRLMGIARDMEGKTICVFADAAAWPVQSYIAKFRPEFEEHIKSGRCSSALCPMGQGSVSHA